MTCTVDFWYPDMREDGKNASITVHIFDADEQKDCRVWDGVACRGSDWLAIWATVRIIALPMQAWAFYRYMLCFLRPNVRASLPLHSLPKSSSKDVKLMFLALPQFRSLCLCHSRALSLGDDHEDNGCECGRERRSKMKMTMIGVLDGYTNLQSTCSVLNRGYGFNNPIWKKSNPERQRERERDEEEKP